MDYNQLRKTLILIFWRVITFFQIVSVTQGELSVVFTDIDSYFNPAYVAPNYEIFLLDEGIDNQVFINVTLIKSPPIDSMSYFNILGATMGEYKINTGFEYHTLMCSLVDEPIIFGRIANELGVGGCPLKIGNYGNEAYEIDTSTLPDTFPPNKYIMNVWAETNDGENIGNFTLYFTMQ